MTVNPGAVVDHFLWTVQPGASQTAGTALRRQDHRLRLVRQCEDELHGGTVAPDGLRSAQRRPARRPCTTARSLVERCRQRLPVTDYKAETTNLVASDGLHPDVQRKHHCRPGPTRQLHLDDTSPARARRPGRASAPRSPPTTRYGNVKTNYTGNGGAFTVSGLGTIGQLLARVRHESLVERRRQHYRDGLQGGDDQPGRKRRLASRRPAEASLSARAHSAALPGQHKRARARRPGQSFGAAITAYDTYGNVKTNYTGERWRLHGFRCGTSRELLARVRHESLVERRRQHHRDGLQGGDDQPGRKRRLHPDVQRKHHCRPGPTRQLYLDNASPARTRPPGPRSARR